MVSFFKNKKNDARGKIAYIILYKLNWQKCRPKSLSISYHATFTTGAGEGGMKREILQGTGFQVLRVYVYKQQIFTRRMG
jgi:hypothetical protein